MLSQSGGGASSFRTPFSLYLDIPKKVYTSIFWKGLLNAGHFRELSFRLLVHHLPFGPSISFGSSRDYYQEGSQRMFKSLRLAR